MTTPDLETRIRAYYKTCQPGDSARLMLASQVLLDDVRRPSPRRLLWGSLRLAATLAAVTVLLAVLVLPRLGTAVGPGSGAASPGPTFDLPAALNAQVDEAGLMRSGGIWAVQGSYLLTSTDNGATWRAGTFPSPGGVVAVEGVFVLDPNHAWAITSNGMNGGLASPALAGQLFVLNRTTDGGRTWQSTTVSGDYRCDSAAISFVDADRGFIMCSFGSTAGPNGSNNEVRTQATRGSGTVLRTDDGGASWSVAGSATGLGSQFTASDANTLWSKPDAESSDLTGPTLYVSRDAGATWTSVDLPGMYSNPIPGPVSVSVDAGPVFWDAANGAIAIGVWVAGTSTQPAVWFYRTSDTGRSWSLVKEQTQFPLPGNAWPLAALVGREWAVIGTTDSPFLGLTESSDFGATWTTVPGSGMPENASFLTVDLVDKDHGIATVFVNTRAATADASGATTGSGGPRVLMQTSDGGRTWHAANFGDARAKLGANSGDVGAVKNLAVNYTTMATKDPPTAWNMLSAYSQRAFGSESAFEAAMVALGTRTNYALAMGEITNSAAAISQQKLGPGVWGDLTALADLSRAYAVAVTFPSSSEPPETIVIAPLSATGDWRVWVATMP
jgi:photosystem II stability/assembly factor-like uncharacterized protein